jgi:hypothetical protein
MITFKPALLAAFCALGLSAQVRVNETAVLPAGANSTDIILIPPDNAPKGSQASAGQIVDKNRRPVSPQPTVTITPADGSLKVSLSGVYFWGDAVLPITFKPAAPALTAIYNLERGVTLTSVCSDVPSNQPGVTCVDVPRNQPGVIWVHNPGIVALRVAWRVVSSTESLCGLDGQGHLRKDCDSASNLPTIRIPATGSAPIRFYVPPWWRSPLEVFGGTDTRSAQLNLRFGQEEPRQQFDSDLRLDVHSSILDAATAWVPELVRNLLRVLFWITVGATLLMMAQVVIPNFRRSLQMETRIDELKERLRAINSGVGSRLFTKCQQEISRVTEGLGIREPRRLPKSYAWSTSSLNINRVALCGNSQEILRLEGLLPKIESRIALTERLSDVLTAFLSADTLASAPSSVFDREEQLRSLREILSRQLLTDAEEDNASSILTTLEAGAPSPADFAADLNTRLQALRRQLASDVFKTRAAKYIHRINGCADILNEPTGSTPPSGWTVDELVFRDLMAVKLRFIVFAVEIESLLARSPDVDTWIQERLESSDPSVLAGIHTALKRISEGVSDDDILAALKNELWDTLSEPAAVRSQDVLQFSFTFRNKVLNRSSARNSFHCYWRTLEVDTGAESWEEGWTIQYIPSFSRFIVEPAIYDSAGHELPILKEEAGKGTQRKDGRASDRKWAWRKGREIADAARNRKGAVEIRVMRATGLSTRAIRGFIDAVITALVPVVTVAITQVQNGEELTADKLILLGFTSQAIRAAVLPESVRPEAAPRNTAPDSRSPAKPAPPSPSGAPPPSGLSPADTGATGKGGNNESPEAAPKTDSKASGDQTK